MALGTLVERSLSLLGYPSATHGLLNRHVDSAHLDVAPSTTISMGCLLRGRITLGPHARLSRGCILNGDITIGTRTNFEPDCDLVGDIEIGNYCAIARETTFQQTNHEITKPSMQIRLYDDVLDSDLPPTADGPIDVGNDVWIGTGATILSGVTIGDGAIIGAGAVVTTDVEPYSIVAGVPAEQVKWRFPEEIREQLLALEWWEWDEDTMRENREFFEQTLPESDGALEAVLAREGESGEGGRPPPSTSVSDA